jgi:hypothetical protein
MSGAATRRSSTTTVLDQLHAAVDALLDVDLTRLDRDELLGLCTGVETETRRLAVADHRRIAELDARHLGLELGTRSTAGLLHQLLRITGGQARARTAAAGELGPRRTLTGDPLPALYPTVAAAQAAGEISAAHARVITAGITVLPAEIEFSHGRTLETNLVEQARHLDPAALASQVRRLLDRLDPDGPEPDEREQQRHRGLDLRMRRDGTAEVSGRLTAWAAATWTTILDALSAPAPAENGELDPRTATQRRHDALLDAGQRILRSGDLPDTGGTPVTILVHIPDADLHEQHGYGTTEHGHLLHAATLAAEAGDGAIQPVRLDAHGAVLSLGRAQRLASCAQRRALAVRDGGCCFPGCTIPASWCQTHHVIAWIDGGRTDLDNLALLCGHHHRMFAKLGWECVMIHGVPHWRPPAWIDPARRPRRNTAHHTELLFTPPENPDRPVAPAETPPPATPTPPGAAPPGPGPLV